MERKQDICPYCGSEETVTGKQTGQGCVVPENGMTFFFNTQMIHVICRSCGTVIRSYVKDPEVLT